jgi:hypothetical protein
MVFFEQLRRNKLSYNALALIIGSKLWHTPPPLPLYLKWSLGGSYGTASIIFQKYIVMGMTSGGVKE